ncbi:MAG: PTS sugar transporter subunit IIA [Leuconostoc gelidum]|jgi:PTS system ascorbate-specific IIA component|uniref:PTS sugar transporter subunit IIA n=1 Tax=Leuconostoc gelidum TaxID=1244 RepID=UPI001575C95D|nr:PTS sugar transporter subunit IIA [Leuconostoc gelidum]MBZ5978785.1 PTS sugar transporter subunit IIA [Leuconostoc gelidum subsp. gelidum]MBZ6001795.1 PTS sugar transporter subunit IIA [Leuconostoc gelidum subsp. gelidum]MBZ6009146.1 PTS sugar transporter subunit IIA [Leuconostoc gelidum subsp. aenigmaticum]QDJ29254.1 PTS ascorbate transporter subunit IIA [Leuconostoc gelidum subsp. gelidum]
MTMLKYFYDNDLVRIYDKTPTNWREAINVASENLKEKNIITDEYVREVIKNVETNGAYIVITPGVVMPHALATGQGVLGTGIGFAKFSEPVSFEDGNPDKQGKLFFTLAAKDETQHLENIQNLMTLLMTDGMIEALSDIETLADFVQVMGQFENTPAEQRGENDE